MKQDWKDIPGYEGLYKINSDGIVMSKGRRGTTNEDFIRTPIINEVGYPRISLRKKPYLQKFFYVHRLVALVFIPNPENKKEVNHKNGVRHDTRVENLEWCDRQENIDHAFNSGNMTKPRKPVIKMDFNYNEIKKYSSLHQAGKDVGRFGSNIRFAINTNGVCAGHFWKYA